MAKTFGSWLFLRGSEETWTLEGATTLPTTKVAKMSNNSLNNNINMAIPSADLSNITTTRTLDVADLVPGEVFEVRKNKDADGSTLRLGWIVKTADGSYHVWQRHKRFCGAVSGARGALAILGYRASKKMVDTLRDWTTSEEFTLVAGPRTLDAMSARGLCTLDGVLTEKGQELVDLLTEAE